MFVVYSNNDQLNRVLSYLEPFKLATLKERLVMGYLNEKLLAIKAFTSAKTKLEKFLKKNVPRSCDCGRQRPIDCLPQNNPPQAQALKKVVDWHNKAED